MWKYFGSVGAADKNTMVTVETLLLGFSSTAMGYLFTKVLCLRPFFITAPYQGIGLAFLGLVISCVATYVALLYGRYSNWNWANADAIARQRQHLLKWKKLLPENAELPDGAVSDRRASRLCVIANGLGRPCLPSNN